MRLIFLEHKRFLQQIFRLAKSELIKSYKGSALGPVWSVIKPGITIFVYWFAFQIGLRAARTVTVAGITVDFFQFLMVGLTPWFFMKEAILKGANCFRAIKAFVTKMSFPVSTIPTYKLLSELISHVLLLAVVYVVLILTGGKPSVYNLQIFFYMPFMYMFFVFLAWITAPLSVISVDFLNIVRSIIAAIFWLSGIIYNPYGLDSELLRTVMMGTPVAYFANGYRNAFLFEQWFWETPYETGMMILWTIVVFILGLYTYTRLRKKIPDML